MSLADILERMRADSEGEAAAVVSAAEEEARSLLDDARAAADAAAQRVLRDADNEAERVSGTILANARLAARDKLLATKGALIDRVMSDATASIRALPDEEYAAVLARAVVTVARGRETLLFAAADRERLASALPVALAAASAPAITIGSEDAPVDSGVALVGDRMIVDLSVESLIRSSSQELTANVASILFAEEA